MGDADDDRLHGAIGRDTILRGADGDRAWGGEGAVFLAGTLDIGAGDPLL